MAHPATGLASVVVVDFVRTPIGRFGGLLKDIRPDDMAAHVVRALLARSPQLNPADIEAIILGDANQAGEDNRNVARMAALLADLPVSVAGVTVNQLCGSGLVAINQAAQAIALGQGEVMIAGGVESMTRAPFVMAKTQKPFARQVEIHDTTIGWRFTNAKLSEKHHPYSMGETAENVAERYELSREAQDAFALASQQKASVAQANGVFDAEIVPIAVPGSKRGETVMAAVDEHPRADTTLADLAKLKPVFRSPGTVTAGNASGINDGAAVVLLMTEAKALALGLKPLARFVSTAVAGVDPACMGLGPVPATQKALQRAGLTVADLAVIELNEAFASQSLACIQELGLDPERINLHGGAIALGHPLGASGGRILGHLARCLQDTPSGAYGLATMCVGVGQGVATILQRYNLRMGQ